MSSNAAGHQSSSQQVDPAVDKLVRETKALKAKIDLLEAENKALKKSLFDLSYIYSAQLGSHTKKRQDASLNSSSVTNEDNANTLGASSSSCDDINRQSSAHGDMAWAVGQLLSNLSAAQQSQGSDVASSSAANHSDTTSRGVDAQLKNAADLIKVEDEGVRRLNMGSIGKSYSA